MLYQNAYEKKKIIKKDPNGNAVPEGEEQDQFSDGELDQIKDKDDLDRIEQEDLEDEELMRQKENPEFYEDTIEYQHQVK